MSTKIYNAYKFEGSIQELMEELKELQKKINLYFTKTDILTQMAIELEIFCGFSKPVQELSIRDWYDVISTARNKMERTGAADELSANCVVFFYQKKLYVKFFNLPQSIKLNKNFTNFEYWNNTDQPKGISDKQWQARAKLWDNICRSGIPAEDGLTYEFFRIHDLISIAESLYKRFKKK